MYLEKFLNEARNHDRKMRSSKVKNALGLSAVLTKLFSTNFKLLIQNKPLSRGGSRIFSRKKFQKKFTQIDIPSSPKSLKRPNFDKISCPTAEFLKKIGQKRRFRHF